MVGFYTLDTVSLILYTGMSNWKRVRRLRMKKPRIEFFQKNVLTTCRFVSPSLCHCRSFCSSCSNRSTDSTFSTGLEASWARVIRGGHQISVTAEFVDAAPIAGIATRRDRRGWSRILRPWSIMTSHHRPADCAKLDIFTAAGPQVHPRVTRKRQG